MAWKTFQGRRYFYRTVHIGREAKSVYVGRGPAAELMAGEIERRKELRATKRKAVRDAKACAGDLQQMAQEAAEQFQLLLVAVFVAGGLYLHHRSEWRPRRFVNGSKREPIALKGAV